MATQGPLDKEWLERAIGLESLVSTEALESVMDTLCGQQGSACRACSSLKAESGQVLVGQRSQLRPGKGRVITALGAHPWSTEALQVCALARALREQRKPLRTVPSTEDMPD